MKYKHNMTPEERELFCLECLIAFNVACRDSLSKKHEKGLIRQYNQRIARLIGERNKLVPDKDTYYGA